MLQFTSVGTKKNNLRKNHYFDGERKLKFPSSEDKASAFNNTYQWKCTLRSVTIALPFHLSCSYIFATTRCWNAYFDREGLG